MRDLQRLQHLVKGDGVQRLAQGEVDADQHHPQFLVGEHHADRHRRHGLPTMRGGQGLQHFGVPRIAVVRRAGQCQCLLVQRRRDQGADLSSQSSLGRPDHTFRGHAAGAGADCAHGHQRRRRYHLQNRQAARRQLARVFWRTKNRYRQDRLTRGDLLRRAPQRGHITRHKTSAGQLRRITKGFGNNLRPNAGWVTQCDGNQGEICGSWHGRHVA